MSGLIINLHIINIIFTYMIRIELDLKKIKHQIGLTRTYGYPLIFSLTTVISYFTFWIAHFKFKSKKKSFNNL